jgi:hypothetical protein
VAGQERRLLPVVARVIEFTVTSRDRGGRPLKTSRYRELTALLDDMRYPTARITALYAERWQIKSAYGCLGR